jgi:hypothetical protein
MLHYKYILRISLELCHFQIFLKPFRSTLSNKNIS